MAKADDESIPGDTFLLRALRCHGWWIVENDRVRATSLAFLDSFSGETSCHFDKEPSRFVLAGRFSNCPIARFTAGQARSCGFHLTRDPEGDPSNSANHVVLTFAEEGARRKIYQGACKKLALLCEVLQCADLGVLPENCKSPQA